MKHIVILTGAGISAESGLATFRDSGGLWNQHRVEDVATPEAYQRDKRLVQSFYNARRRQLAEVSPNAAHEALAALAAKPGFNVTLVTQNVDDLHQRSLGEALAEQVLIPMHGELTKARCPQSGRIYPCQNDLGHEMRCECCQPAFELRPHIVWFGEMPLYMERIEQALLACDLFISIGTSGNVYPAAGFVQLVRRFGHGHTVELNLEPSEGSRMFHERHHGPATQIVPQYIDALLKN